MSPGGTLRNQIFPLPCLPFRYNLWVGHSVRDRWPVRSLKFRLGLTFLNYVSYLCSARPVPLDISGLVGFWKVFIGCILENICQDLTGIRRVELSSLLIYWIYSLWAWPLGNEYLVLYLYNKSALTENHSLSAGYLTFYYSSSAAGGSRSTAIVERGAELVMVYVCVVREVSEPNSCWPNPSSTSITVIYCVEEIPEP
jgi:hypothetical protein